MRKLSHESGNYGNVQKIKLVRESVCRDRDDARICEYDLFKAACGRVAVVCGKKVGLNIFPDLRDLFDECAADAVALFFSRVLSHGTSELAEIERNKDLLVQAVEDVFDHYRELIFEVVGLISTVLEITGIHYEKQIVYDVDDLVPVRLVEDVRGIDILAAVIISDDLADEICYLFFSRILFHFFARFLSSSITD